MHMSASSDRDLSTTFDVQMLRDAAEVLWFERNLTRHDRHPNALATSQTVLSKIVAEHSKAGTTEALQTLVDELRVIVPYDPAVEHDRLWETAYGRRVDT